LEDLPHPDRSKLFVEDLAMRPKPISGLDPDLFANPKPGRWSDFCRPSLLAGLMMAGSLGVLALAVNATSRAGDAPPRFRPIPPGAGPRVSPPWRVLPFQPGGPPTLRPRPVPAGTFIIAAPAGIDDPMIVAAPAGIDDPMIIPSGQSRGIQSALPMIPQVVPIPPAPAPLP
jgi:hypothetical protein